MRPRTTTAAGLVGTAFGAVLVLGLYLAPGGGVRPDRLLGAVVLGPLALWVTRAADPVLILPGIAAFYGVATALLVRAAGGRRRTAPAAVAYALIPLGIVAYLTTEISRPFTGMTPITMLSMELDNETQTIRHLMTYHPAVFAAGAVLLGAWHAFAWRCLLRPWFGPHGPLGCFRRRPAGR